MSRTQAPTSPQTFHNHMNGGKNFNNFSNGSQNFYKGRDFHQNSGAGRIVVNYGSRDDWDEEDDKNQDKVLSAPQLRKELTIFKRQSPNLENDHKEIDCQEYLDKWQRMILSDLPDKILSLVDKTSVLDAMSKISDLSGGLSPRCVRIQDVGIVDLARDVSLDFHGPDVEVFKGKVGTLDVIVKALKKPGPSGERLESLLKQAITWRKLHHKNVLSFLGLYYFDDSRSRLCVVYPLVEQHSLDEDVPDGDDSCDRFAESVINGLEHIHSFPNVVHGDLQKWSLLIGLSDVARIADLGLAQLLKESTGMNADSEKYQCARVLGKSLYGLSVPSTPISRPERMSNAVWDVLKEWLSKGLPSSAGGTSRNGN
ncbi:Receptor-interacting serine/threonine-protein kinase 1 [Marasmius sp. AFHP31]|nr:Receptor-interacting serine/threonine-protein kinase 1 [Marasmius sp. AFHP31]